MNFMDDINSRFSKLSCKEIKQEKKELEYEIKRRRYKKISEINLEYSRLSYISKVKEDI